MKLMVQNFESLCANNLFLVCGEFDDKKHNKMTLMDVKLLFQTHRDYLMKV